MKNETLILEGWIKYLKEYKFDKFSHELLFKLIMELNIDMKYILDGEYIEQLNLVYTNNNLFIYGNIKDIEDIEYIDERFILYDRESLLKHANKCLRLLKLKNILY